MTTDTAPRGQAHETEIAIIGCGPVGAMLANLLGLQGIATLVLDTLKGFAAVMFALHIAPGNLDLAAAAAVAGHFTDVRELG